MLPRLLSPFMITLVLTGSLLAMRARSPEGARTAEVDREHLFISVPELLSARWDTITVLDARSASAFNRGHIPHAMHVSWLDYRNGWGRTGRLTDNLELLSAQLAELGVRNGQRVVVYGDAADGWGEEGRIAWTLQYLGHRKVSVLNGGFPAWQQLNGPVTRASTEPAEGNFTPRVDGTLRAYASDVAAARASGAIILDTRSLDEWNGSWRYLPARAGRIPGAIHLEWSALLNDEGLLDTSSAAYARLRAKGLTVDRPIIAYCVGGVRSAFVAMALRELGFRDVRNYDGSWYEWAADRTRPVEKAAPDSP